MLVGLIDPVFKEYLGAYVLKIFLLQGPTGAAGPIGYPGPRGVKVGASCFPLVTLISPECVHGVLDTEHHGPMILT